MINKFSCLIVSWQINQGYLKEDDRELYQYAFVLLTIQVLNFIAGVLVGIFTGELLIVLGFLLCFIPLRSYAGGYHADSPEICSLSSIILLIMLALIVHFEIYETILPILLILTVMAELYIWKKVPVAAKNKPLSQNESALYRTRSHQIQAIEILILLITLIFGFDKLFFVVSLSHIIMAVLIWVTPTP